MAHPKRAEMFLTWIRRSFLLGSLSLLAISELLSAFGHLDRFPFLVAISIISGVAGAAMARWPCLRPGSPRILPEDKPWLVLLGTILLATLATGFLWPPNNWDSMTYHLPRVDHWIQNGSVAFYPTGNLRQTVSPPLSALGILFTVFLSGSDVLANSVQWVGFAICVCTAMEASRLLGGGRSSQWASGCLVATLPMALLQSSSTQNDVLAAAFLLSTATEILRSREVRRPSWSFAWIGLSAGLGLLTKGTLYLFLMPWPLLWIVTSGVAHPRRFLLRFSLAVLVAASLALPHSVRTYRAQATILPTIPGQGVDGISIATIVSNGLRNIAIHTQIPHFLPRWVSYNPATEFLSLAHGWTGLDPVSPETTFDVNFRPFHAREAWAHEDYSGNPFHLVVILVATLLLVARSRGPHARDRILWTGCVLGGAFLMVALLKWQTWGSRLHLPLFAVAIPALTMSIPHRILRPACLALWAVAWFWIGGNFLRPMPPPTHLAEYPREALRFMAQPGLYRPTALFADMASSSGCSEIGLLLGGDDWEHPLTSMIRDRLEGAVRFHHLIGSDSESPCLAIGTLGNVDRAPPSMEDYRADTLAPFIVLHPRAGRSVGPGP